MPEQKERSQKTVDVNPVVHRLGVVSQWLRRQENTRITDDDCAKTIHFARCLKHHLKSPNWDNENQLVDSMALCETYLDKELKTVLAECEDNSASLRLKCELERKLFEYQDKQIHHAFWEQSKSVYQAKRSVVFALKCYLHDDYTLEDLLSVIDENKSKYKRGWGSTLKEMVNSVKAIKREQLYAICQNIRLCSSGDQTLVVAIENFARNEMSLVDLMGTYELNKSNNLSQHIIQFYNRALQVDANVAVDVNEEYGAKLCW